MVYKYPNSISDAAKILDKVKPDWHNKIDISALNMVEGDDCILGQLYHHYIDGMEEIFCLDLEDVPDNDPIYLGDSIFGKLASKEDWIKEINSRRTVSFSVALEAMKNGKKTKRSWWGAKSWIKIKDGVFVWADTENITRLDSEILNDDWVVCD